MKLLFLITIAFLSVYNTHAQSCLTNSLIINTGYNPITGTAITPGANGATPVPDPHWTISEISPYVATAITETPITGLIEVIPGNSADVVTKESAWVANPAADPGGWISCLNSNTYWDDATDAVLNMTLSRSFTMCSEDSITLVFYSANDNYISTANIDGTFLFSQPAAALTATYSTYAYYTTTIFLTAGTHTINIEVVDYNTTTAGENPTGLDLYGTVSSATGTNSLISESTAACLSYVCGTLDPCNTVSVPDSLYACTGNVDTLHATVSGTDSILSYTWSPATGLSSTTVLDPALTVGASGWYTINVESLIADNLINNGSFSIGNVGFISPDYTYSVAVPVSNYYTITTDIALADPGFTTHFYDHTSPPTGLMMVINGGSPASNTIAWQETVPVTAGDKYDFTAWYAYWTYDVTGASNPNLYVTITPVGGTGTASSDTFATLTSAYVWTEASYIWSAPAGATSAIIQIIDENSAYFYNDFCLDDISFDPICIATDSIYISATTPGTTIVSKDTSVCAPVSSITLTAPAGYTSHTWSTGATTPTIVVGASGSYWVSQVSSCSMLIDTFHVAFNPVPLVNLGNDTTFCSGNSITLHSSDTYTASPTYLWSTGATTPTITVSTTGSYWLDVTEGGCTGTYTVNVGVTPTPVIPVPSSGGPICSGGVISLSVTTTYTTAVTYSWTGPQGFTSTLRGPTIIDADTAATGYYTVVVTFDGCSSPWVSEAVLVDSTPELTASSNSPICQYDSLVFTSNSTTPGVTYLWIADGGLFTNTSQSFVIYDAGVVNDGFYYAIARRGVCTDTVNVTVSVDSIPILTEIGVMSPICAGNTLEFTSAFTPSVFGVVNWSGPNGFTATIGGPSIINAQTNATGVYSVTETLAICTSAVYTVAATVKPTPVAPTVTDNSPVCQGAILQFYATDTAGSVYSWSGPDMFNSSLQNPSLSPMEPVNAGAYSVIATLDSCPSAVTIENVNITLTPTFTPTSNSPVCSGDTLFLYANGVAGSTFTWSGPYAYYAASVSTDPIIYNTTIENAGVYTVSALLNGCTASETDTVVINQTPPPPYVSWLTYCLNYPAPPLMANDTGITWYKGDTVTGVPSYTPPVPSTTAVGSTFYYATQTVDGCQSKIDSIQVTVNPIPTVTVSPADTSVCPNSSFTLTATVTDIDPVANYHWYPSIYLADTNTSSVPVSPETDVVYTVVVSNEFGCSDTATATVNIYPAAVISLTDSVSLYPGQTYTMNPLTNCTSFLWFPPAGLSSTIIADPVASPVINSKYWVYATTENGCTTSDSITINLTTTSLIDLPNAFSPGNGANNMFRIIKKGEVGINYFRIFNRWGQKIFETSNIDQGWDGTFNGVAQPFDVYVYEIEVVSENGQSSLVHGNLTLVR